MVVAGGRIYKEATPCRDGLRLCSLVGAQASSASSASPLLFARAKLGRSIEFGLIGGAKHKRILKMVNWLICHFNPGGVGGRGGGVSYADRSSCEVEIAILTFLMLLMWLNLRKAHYHIMSAGQK